MVFAGPITLNTLLSAGMSAREIGATRTDHPSLEKEPPRRATPWRMLEHPWILDMKNKKVNMANFVKQVWGWDD